MSARLPKFTADPKKLTPMERKVFGQIVLAGRSHKDTAAELGIAAGTLKAHLSQIYRKKGVTCAHELVVQFYQRIKGMRRIVESLRNAEANVNRCERECAAALTECRALLEEAV